MNCANLPPSFQHTCRQNTLNAFVSGQCDRLQGCERNVCQELFANGAYPRMMNYAAQRPKKPTRVYAYGSYPQLSDAAWSAICSDHPRLM